MIENKNQSTAAAEPLSHATETWSEVRRAVIRMSLILGVLHGIFLIVGASLFKSVQLKPQSGTVERSVVTILEREAPEWARRWYHWDALWFVDLSEFGYRLQRNDAGGLAQSNLAFPPGLALVMRILKVVQINPWSGVLIINMIAVVLGNIGLGYFAWLVTEKKSASLLAILLHTAWPWHFFMVAPYQEALGTAFLVWALVAMIKRQTVFGFFLSFAAAAFRLNVVGLFGGIIAVSVWERFIQKKKSDFLSNIIISFGAIISWFSLLVYFQNQFGSAQVGVGIQMAWNRESPHLGGIIKAIISPLFHHLTGTGWLDWTVSILVLLSLPIIWHQAGMKWAVPQATLLCMGLATGSVMSTGRFMILGIPFFVCFGKRAACRPRVFGVIGIGCFLLQIILMLRFGRGLFSG